MMYFLLFSFIIDSTDSVVIIDHTQYTSLNKFCENRNLHYEWDQFSETFSLIIKDTISFIQDQPFVNIKDSIIRIFSPIKLKNQLFVNLKNLNYILKIQGKNDL